MKRFLTTFFITCLAAAVYAQNGKVTMTVVDSQTKEGVAGAVIEFKLSDGSADPKYYTSGFNGKADIAGLKSADYDMTISFLGYDDLAKKITVKADRKRPTLPFISFTPRLSSASSTMTAFCSYHAML